MSKYKWSKLVALFPPITAHTLKDVWLTNINNDNIIFFDLNAEGIGVLKNRVVLPPNIQATDITCLEIIQMLQYTEFASSDDIFVDTDKVIGDEAKIFFGNTKKPWARD